MSEKIYLETIKSVDAKIYHLSYHQRRYESVLKDIGSSSIYNLKDYLTPPDDGIYRCRLTFTASKISVTYHKYQKRRISSFKLVFDNNIEYSKKSIHRDEIDKLFILRDTFDEILIVKDSFITDTSIANIALYNSGVWYTPKKPLLKGTTRARLIDEGKIVESDISVDMLSQFSKVALLNAMVEFDILEEFKFIF